MGEVIVGGVIALVSLIAGSLLTYIFEERRHKAEEKRWLAEYFMDRKVSSINELWLSPLECKDVLLRTSATDFSSRDEFNTKITERVERYRKAKMIASVYVSDEQEKKLNSALGAFNRASTALFVSLPDKISGVQSSSYSDQLKNIDYEQLDQKSREALDSLKTLLNPKVLADFNHIINPQ